MLLSACMIVKNESLIIQRCLESLRDVADEIIVVDTGSADDTVKIAEEYGAKIYTYEWDNHFGNARNESLRHASGEFILVIDADEYLDSLERKNLREFLLTTTAEGIMTPIQNYIGSISRLSDSAPITVMRIFRRGHRFTGAIHEQVLNSVMATGKPIEKFNLTIHHLGYLNEFVVSKNKSERNMALLEKELENNPTNVFHTSNMMAEYVRLEEYEKCAVLAESTYERFKESPDAPHHLIARVVKYLIFSMWQSGSLEKAEYYAKEGIVLFPNLADIRRQYALFLLSQDRAQEALSVLMKCREIGDSETTLIDTLSGVGSYLAAADLGEAWLRLGDEQMALEWYLRSFSEFPRLENVIIALVRLLPRDSALLREVPNRIDDWVALGAFAEAYSYMGYGDAEQVISSAEAKLGETEFTRRARIAHAAHKGHQAITSECTRQNSQTAWYLFGIYLLNEGRVEHAKDNLLKGGPRGESFLSIYECVVNGSADDIKLGGFVHDLITVRASRLLKVLLPHAVDRETYWFNIRQSPERSVLSDIEWPGSSGWECEQNIVRLFRQQRFEESVRWLEKGLVFPPTVTKIMLELDIALAYGDTHQALATLSFGEHLFPESKLLQSTRGVLFSALGQTPSLSLTVESGRSLSNPLSTLSMTHVSLTAGELADIHQHGAEITKQIGDLEAQEDVNALRQSIKTLRAIIAQCRATLNPLASTDKMRDATYKFYDDLSVKWYFQPHSARESLAAAMDFWNSWAETWGKIAAPSGT